MDDMREKLLTELRKRIAFDNRYSWQHLYVASFWNWAAIISSFVSACLALVGTFPTWIVAVLAAVPGIAVFVLQRFLFYRRSRFHRIMQVNVEKLVRSLEYEDADPREISKQYSLLMIQMEPLYPGHGLDGLSHEIAKDPN